MKRIISLAVALAGFSATAFPADRHIAFERNNAVDVANPDDTNEKKIADGIFPAISSDGTRVAFNTVAGPLTGNRFFSPRVRTKSGISSPLIQTGQIFMC